MRKFKKYRFNNDLTYCVGSIHLKEPEYLIYCKNNSQFESWGIPTRTRIPFRDAYLVVGENEIYLFNKYNWFKEFLSIFTG